MKVDLSHALPILRKFLPKKGNVGYDGYRIVKGVKRFSRFGEVTSLFIIVPANKSDSTLYIRLSADVLSIFTIFLAIVFSEKHPGYSNMYF